MKPKRPVPRISEAEWLVMRALWTRSPATAGDVVASLPPGTGWNPKTVLSLINRLVAKGAVGFRKEARSHLYFPKVTESECIGAESRAFRQRLFGGAFQPMFAHLVQETDLSAQDLDELRRMLDKMRSDPPKP